MIYQQMIGIHYLMFYDQCLPSNSLTIGYTSSSIHWLSQKPCNISNHCVCIPLKCEQIEAFRSQARDDYEQFLKNRSRELINGGVLIANIFSVNDQGESMFGGRNMFQINRFFFLNK